MMSNRTPLYCSVVYRNYSSVSDILASSEWCSKPSQLRKFLNRVEPEGGMGNEAIEIALFQVVQDIQHSEKPITQVILIGDAPPNTLEEAQNRQRSFDRMASRLRGSLWDRFWLYTDASCQTLVAKCPYDYKTPLAMIAQNGVRIDGFYIVGSGRDDETRDSFEAICSQTKNVKGRGSVTALNVNDPNVGAQELTEAITMTILGDVASDAGKAELFRQTYKKLYPRNSEL